VNVGRPIVTNGAFVVIELSFGVVSRVEELQTIFIFHCSTGNFEG